jgi:hypothetical protein
MAYRMQPRGPVFPKIAAAIGVITFVSGSVLVYFVPTLSQPEKKPSTAPTPTGYFLPSVSSPQLMPRQPLRFTKPSKSSEPTSSPSKKPTPKPKPTTSAPVTATPGPVSPPRPSRTSVPAPPTSAKPSAKPTPVPTARPTSSTPPPVSTTPTVRPSTPQPGSTTWSTDPEAVAAAQRMAAKGAVGDPVCSLASFGEPDYTQIPGGLKSVGVGSSGGYWCLIFKR